MQNAADERYVFLRWARDDLAEALSLLDLYNEDHPLRVRYAVLRYAVICYFRPFSPAQTVHEFPQPDGSMKRRIKLLDRYVPAEHMALHKELKMYRDSAYAHTDLDARQPRVSYWPDSPLEFPIGFRPVDRRPLHILIEQMRSLFEGVAQVVTQEGQAIEAQIRADHQPTDGA